MIVHLYGFQNFRIVLKSKGNASVFSNFVWRTDGRGASGRRDQTCETEIYFMIVHFYYFKCFRKGIEKQRKRSPFFKFGLGKEMPTILEI